MPNFLFSKKGLFILAAIVVIIVLLFFLLRPAAKLPTKFPKPTTIPAPTTIPPVEEIKRISSQDVKDLRWLTNTELSYTFFDPSIKQRVLIKTDGVKESVLIKNIQVKMSELYWSKRNNLLIFDYGDPYKTYLVEKAQALRPLNINGYAFSWSPDADSFFYLNIEKNGQEVPKIYNIETGATQTVDIIPPPFQVSFWSPSGSLILLYNHKLEEGRGELQLLDLNSKSISKVTNKNVSFPSWAPSIDRLAYVANGGLYTYSREEGERLIYQTASSAQFISYIWLTNSEMLVFDAEQKPPSFLKISLVSGMSKTVLSSLRLQSTQRIQLSLSPNQETLAVGSEKNGLWFIKATALE